jgi:hypothetical protein
MIICLAYLLVVRMTPDRCANPEKTRKQDSELPGVAAEILGGWPILSFESSELWYILSRQAPDKSNESSPAAKLQGQSALDGTRVAKG